MLSLFCDSLLTGVQQAADPAKPCATVWDLGGPVPSSLRDVRS